MKRLGLALVAASVVSAVAFAQALSIENGDPDVSLSNCSSSGSSASAVTAGVYKFTTSSDEGVFLCVAKSSATCASGGDYYPPNTILVRRFRESASVACRSASSTGDAYFKKATVTP